MSKRVILIGAGSSLKEGIDNGLWDKIKNEQIWSLNSIFKIMPYLPSVELWVDFDFFKHEAENLKKLHQSRVELITKDYRKLAYFTGIITQYETTRDEEKYFGKKALEKKLMYTGQMGFVSQFALSIAIARKYDEIYLLVYDFGPASLEDKNTHVFQDQMKELNILATGAGRPNVYLQQDGQPRREIREWDIYNRETDIKIYNVSLKSNIPYFEKISYIKFFELISKL